MPPPQPLPPTGVSPALLRAQWQPVPLPGAAPAVQACLLGFDPRAFEPADFARFGIACPPQVARSVPKRQAEFLFGRLAARTALQAIGCTAAEVGIGASREPLWPEGVVGSITHCQGLAAAVAVAATACPGIGIDIERLVEPSAQDALLALALDAGELRTLQAFADRLPLPMLVTLAFSAKESLYKGAFGSVGRFFDFAAARLDAVAPDAGRIALVLREHLNADFPDGLRCPVGFAFLDPRTVLTAFARTPV